MNASEYTYEELTLPDDYPPRVDFLDPTKKLSGYCRFPLNSPRATRVTNGAWLGDAREFSPDPRETSRFLTFFTGSPANRQLEVTWLAIDPRTWVWDMLGLDYSEMDLHEQDKLRVEHGSFFEFRLAHPLQAGNRILDADEEAIAMLLDLVVVLRSRGGVLREGLEKYVWGEGRFKKQCFRYRSVALERVFERHVGNE